MSLTENNKLIAAFMGLCYINDIKAWQIGTKERYLDFPSAQISPLDSDYVIVRELKYDSSWEWLIPVVEKIRATEFEGFSSEMIVKIDFGQKINLIQVRQFPIGHSSKFVYSHLSEKGDAKKSTYDGVVKFIKWYNSTVTNLKWVEPTEQDLKQMEGRANRDSSKSRKID